MGKSHKSALLEIELAFAVDVLLVNVNADYLRKEHGVRAIDASLVLDYYSKASTGQSESFDDTQKKAADVNKNGSINAVDASLILSYYVYTSTANGEIEPFETFMNR